MKVTFICEQHFRVNTFDKKSAKSALRVVAAAPIR